MSKAPRACAGLIQNTATRFSSLLRASRPWNKGCGHARRTAKRRFEKRLRNASEEMKRMPDFHQVVVNDQFEPAYAELHAIVQSQLRGGGGA